MTDKPRTASAQRYFESHATAFDRAYDRRWRRRFLSRGLDDGLRIAVEAVASRPGCSVLDVGCGPGRVGEALLAAGAGSYCGIDLSAAMIKMARRRLSGCDGPVELIVGDFAELPTPGRFDLVVAYGIWEYIDDPLPTAKAVARACAGATLFSFPFWTWAKGPLREWHYRREGCRLRYYSEQTALRLVTEGGFENVEILRTGRGGAFLRANPSTTSA